jgi:hypothetical protein
MLNTELKNIESIPIKYLVNKTEYRLIAAKITTKHAPLEFLIDPNILVNYAVYMDNAYHDNLSIRVLIAGMGYLHFEHKDINNLWSMRYSIE